MLVCTKIAIQIDCKLGGATWRVVIPEPVWLIVNYKFVLCKFNNILTVIILRQFSGYDDSWF